MISRKSFLKASLLSGLLPFKSFAASSAQSSGVGQPRVISTWKHGIPANDAAWKVIAAGGTALDAAEAGVRVTEADPNTRTVGRGGYPDRDGNVTLDACIMNHREQCGSVAYLQHIVHPVSVARDVMEETPHVMLVGDGALQFALAQGYKKEEMLTEQSRRDWEEWKKTSNYQPEVNIENHDTIGMLAIDKEGNLSGACTTSGMAWKMNGRVGDSPIIGAGLFVDNEVGAAAATGVGEEVIRVCGSHLVVENMRRGDDPVTACRRAVERIVSKNKSMENKQVAFIALNKQGVAGGYAVHKGFSYAVHDGQQNQLLKSESWMQ